MDDDIVEDTLIVINLWFEKKLQCGYLNDL